MNQKLYLLFYFAVTVIFSSYGQFYPVHEMQVTLKNEQSKLFDTKVPSFCISNFITVKEFKVYLQTIKKDSTESFYQSQFPTSRTFDVKMFKNILADPVLQNEPMPGVSWTVARNYCQWLTAQSKTQGQNYEYDLPTVAEMIAFNNLYGSNTANKLETWTLNCYDESMFLNSELLYYQYEAKKTDPPSMKRKVFFGGSYHMNYTSKESRREFLYEYQDSSSRYIGFRVVKKSDHPICDTLLVNHLNVKFCLKNNQFEGIYLEKYNNGKLKIIGTFSNGQRIGIWTVWDTLGVIKIQRNYQNNKTCEFLFPFQNNPFANIYHSNPSYVLEKNDQNIYPYNFTEERTVIYSKRIWREINVVNEPDLFRNIDFKLLIQEMFKSDIKWYKYGENGDLKNELPKDYITQLELSSIEWDLNRLEIKEDFFFNLDLLMSDTRQIAISFYKNQKDNKPSYTVYFPKLRKIMGGTNLVDSNYDEIKTVDDLFFFHLYRGNIIGSGNVYTDSKTNNSKLIDLECELEKITDEHDLWIVFGR
jgi:antitoxin component YwqK of YwqJK toxin-antitoxin module